jgi:TetR/AcrR family transcriptional repressor of lmrAB and yxaGH operons
VTAAAARTNDARDRMVRAADELFRAQGLHATGVAEILERSGAPRGSLYHYFPGGKEQLAVEAIEHAAARFCRAIGKAIEVNDGSLAEAVRLYGQAMAERLLATDFVEGCPIGNSAIEGSVGSAAISQACDRAFRDFAGVMADHLTEQGVERGQADDLATFVVSTVEGALLVARVRRDTQPVIDATERLATMMQAALDDVGVAA